jgi:hypothetical protein
MTLLVYRALLRTYALVQIGPDPTPSRRLHKAQGAPMIFGQPGHHRLLPADKVLHGFERGHVVQTAVRRAVVARDGVLDQFIEFVERDVEAQVTLGVSECPAQITRMRTRVTGQT